MRGDITGSEAICTTLVTFSMIVASIASKSSWLATPALISLAR